MGESHLENKINIEYISISMSMHGEFRKFFIEKVRSLGITVLDSLDHVSLGFKIEHDLEQFVEIANYLATLDKAL